MTKARSSYASTTPSFAYTATFFPHFTVFKDVFAIPQPVDPEQLGGCQIMVQSGDRREDWETALTFMYSPLE